MFMRMCFFSFFNRQLEARFDGDYSTVLCVSCRHCLAAHQTHCCEHIQIRMFADATRDLVVDKEHFSKISRIFI